ncbi:MAG: PadR family transcriptional regulator [Candidatus Kariarchaeaceae archaeon]|jgi:DNA-binding PadR family transcriptional regulator
MVDDYSLLAKWEVEFKKGFAKPLILFALYDDPNYPYNLTRVINMKTRGQINIAGSNIYPLLTGLARDGLVSSEKIPKETSGSTGKPQLRTVYSLTAKGTSFVASLQENMVEFLELIIQLSQETKK